MTALFRRYGHDVLDVSEQGLKGTTNSELLSLSTRQRRILVTINYRHFADRSRFPLGSHAGILILRIHPPHWKDINPILNWFLANVNLSLLIGRLTILRRQHYQIFHTDVLYEEYPIL